MSSIDSFFKYALGDIVTHRTEVVSPSRPDYPLKGSHEEKQAWITRERSRAIQPETRYFILERQIQECPGGLQFNYLCRIALDGAVTTSPIWFNEAELRPLTPPEP